MTEADRKFVDNLLERAMKRHFDMSEFERTELTRIYQQNPKILERKAPKTMYLGSRRKPDLDGYRGNG
jgi:hypothetical protein